MTWEASLFFFFFFNLIISRTKMSAQWGQEFCLLCSLMYLST